jgi:beta-phosphoglucomutase family hydrolase
VGLGTAKGLSFSLGVPIVGISTLEAAAYQHAECGLPVCAMFNAGRSEIAYAVYQLANGRWNCVVPESLATIEELCNRTIGKTIFCGEPSDAMLEQIRIKLGDRAVIPEAEKMLRHPASLAKLGEKTLSQGFYDDAATLQPLYLRPPHISLPKSKSSGAITPTTCKHMAVIWDMDGTIVNTSEQHFQAWQTVFGNRGMAFSREDFKKSFGLRNDTVILGVLGPQAAPEEIASISHEKTELFRESVRRDGVSPMPGAIELLSALHQQGIPMAVASSAPRRNAETFVKILRIEPFFKTIVSGEEVVKGKPDPAIFLLAAEKLKTAPHCCVVIEDAVGGIAAARAAGMCSVGVVANHPRENLNLADVVVGSLAELNACDIEKLIQTCDTDRPK